MKSVVRRVFAQALCLVFLVLTERSGFASIEVGPIMNPANNSFYYQLAPATWDAARAEAIGMGGDLVAIKDAAENDWVWTTFDNNADIFYTGLHFDSDKDHFVWANGQPVTYVNFAPGEPDGLIHDGLAVFIGGFTDAEWGAVQKTQIHRSIVEVVNGCPLTGTWDAGVSFFEDGGVFSGVMPAGQSLQGTRAGPFVSLSLSDPTFGLFTFDGTMIECDVLVLHSTQSGPFPPFTMIMIRSRSTYCGDNIVNGGEACDDGNFDANDSCNAVCQVSSPCGDGKVDPGEDCDDGNDIEKDACLSSCELNSCGDGHVRIGVEHCDDGNLTSGDGCSATCMLEAETGGGDVSIYPNLVATGDLFSLTTASDPIETGVWAWPNSTGTVTITEQSTPSNPITGFNVMGTVITITAPDLDPPPSTNPVLVIFRIHKSIVPPGQTASSIQIRKDGVVLLDCDDSMPPCVSSRFDDQFGILIGVLTPSFSDWDLSASVCPPAPLPFDCQPSGSAKLTLKEDGDADRLTWVWKSSLFTPASQFGQPDAANNAYTLCVYDAAGRRLQLNLPAGETCAGKPCWRATAKGFNYLDPDAATGGVRKLGLKSGDAGKAKLLLKALGPALDLPALPFTLPVTAQLRSQDGGCWHAAFPAAQRNDGSRFKARSAQP